MSFMTENENDRLSGRQIYPNVKVCQLKRKHCLVFILPTLGFTEPLRAAASLLFPSTTKPLPRLVFPSASLPRSHTRGLVGRSSSLGLGLGMTPYC
jgi:hypothetical protein